MVLDTKTYWSTDRQSQCDCDFEFDVWVKKCKRLKLGGGEAYYLSSDYAVVVA
jgi:hypothetical protein